jgi:hypothetical protein
MKKTSILSALLLLGACGSSIVSAMEGVGMQRPELRQACIDYVLPAVKYVGLYIYLVLVCGELGNVVSKITSSVDVENITNAS